MREEGRGGGTQLGSELGSDQDLDPDPDPWKILWIRSRQNDADPLDPDPQNCFLCLCARFPALAQSDIEPF